MVRDECAEFFRRAHDSHKTQPAEAKPHLVKVLQGRTGGGPARKGSRCC